jgi:hypothetical protein
MPIRDAGRIGYALILTRDDGSVAPYERYVFEATDAGEAEMWSAYEEAFLDAEALGYFLVTAEILDEDGSVHYGHYIRGEAGRLTRLSAEALT